MKTKTITLVLALILIAYAIIYQTRVEAVMTYESDDLSDETLIELEIISYEIPFFKYYSGRLKIDGNSGRFWGFASNGNNEITFVAEPTYQDNGYYYCEIRMEDSFGDSDGIPADIMIDRTDTSGKSSTENYSGRFIIK